VQVFHMCLTSNVRLKTIMSLITNSKYIIWYRSYCSYGVRSRHMCLGSKTHLVFMCCTTMFNNRCMVKGFINRNIKMPDILMKRFQDMHTKNIQITRDILTVNEVRIHNVDSIYSISCSVSCRVVISSTQEIV